MIARFKINFGDLAADAFELGRRGGTPVTRPSR
jgi:hypothetical protein